MEKNAKKDWTTITVDKEVRECLEKKKIHKRESVNDAARRALGLEV